MDDVTELAKQLGRKIGETDRFKKLRAAQQKLNADEAAKELLGKLESQARKIAEAEQAQKPVEPEDKRKLAELREQVHQHEILQELARVEADYMELMQRVNNALHESLAADDESGGAADTGSAE